MKNYTFSGNHPSMELVAELLNDLKKAETTLAAALARAEAAEGDLRELRENILLALGMDAEDVAALDNDDADSTIRYLMSGQQELLNEIAALRGQLANERERANNAEVRGVELEAALNNEKQMSSLRADLIAALNAEVKNLEAQLAAAANVWQGLAVSVAQHYEQAAEEDGAAYELRRLAGLAGLPVSADSAHEITEELAAAVATLRAQLTELEAELAAIKAAGELRFLEPRFQWSGEVEIDPYEDE